jgi:hypothetical protein
VKFVNSHFIYCVVLFVLLLHQPQSLSAMYGVLDLPPDHEQRRIVGASYSAASPFNLPCVIQSPMGDAAVLVGVGSNINAWLGIFQRDDGELEHMQISVVGNPSLFHVLAATKKKDEACLEWIPMTAATPFKLGALTVLPRNPDDCHVMLTTDVIEGLIALGFRKDKATTHAPRPPDAITINVVWFQKRALQYIQVEKARQNVAAATAAAMAASSAAPARKLVVTCKDRIEDACMPSSEVKEKWLTQYTKNVEKGTRGTRILFRHMSTVGFRMCTILPFSPQCVHIDDVFIPILDRVVSVHTTNKSHGYILMCLVRLDDDAEACPVYILATVIMSLHDKLCAKFKVNPMCELPLAVKRAQEYADKIGACICDDPM